MRSFYPYGNITAVAAAYPGNLLLIGSRGDSVKQVQQCLNKISARYPDIGTIAEDGIFGNGTRNAVVVFQHYFGLDQDGIVGTATWNTIFDNCGGGTEPEIPAYPGTSLSSGSRGEAVGLIQQYLGALRGKYPSIPSALANGYFGPATAQAVAEFQRLFGLTEDGVVGPATWNAIMREYFAKDDGETVEYPGYILRRGSAGDAVLQIQRCLNNVAAYWPGLDSPRIAEDGKFGAGTESAVKAFQNFFILSPDGLVGTDTWERIMYECQAADEEI